MQDGENRTHTPLRVIAFGIFLILFGIVLGILTYISIVGPIFGILLVLFGCLVLWKSARGEPPETLT